MDMQMPEMNGVEATRAIRCLPGMQNVPILAMTANAFDENQRECMTAGMNDFISKPVDPEVLYATLLKWLPSEPITIEQNLTSPVNNKLTQHTQSGATAHSALLLDLTGIDIAKGLKFWDNETAYRAYLTKYLNNYKNAGLDIAEMLSRNDIENAAGLTHKIKGVTGYLGLPEVEQCIVQLNELFHAGIATRDSAEALQKAIDEVCVSAAIWESAAAKDDYQGLI
jgi:CheY-like chemotaxis protein